MLQDGGVVLRNGLTVKGLQKMVGNLPGPGFNRYWIDPRIIGPDGRATFGQSPQAFNAARQLYVRGSVRF